MTMEDLLGYMEARVEALGRTKFSSAEKAAEMNSIKESILEASAECSTAGEINAILAFFEENKLYDKRGQTIARIIDKTKVLGYVVDLTGKDSVLRLLDRKRRVMLELNEKKEFVEIPVSESKFSIFMVEDGV